MPRQRPKTRMDRFGIPVGAALCRAQTPAALAHFFRPGPGPDTLVLLPPLYPPTPRRPGPFRAGRPRAGAPWRSSPGFPRAAGARLREPELMQRRQAFDRMAWRKAFAAGDVGNEGDMGGTGAGRRWMSLFCYEPPALAELLAQLRQRPTQLLVTQGRASAALQAALAQTQADRDGPQRPGHRLGRLAIANLQACPQPA